MKKRKIKILFILFIFMLQSCVSLKPYEMVYINDPEMQIGTDPGTNYRNYIHKIREGATPAGTTKGSGGCGCN